MLLIVAAFSFMGILTKYDLCHSEDFSDVPRQHWLDSTQKATLKWKVINAEKKHSLKILRETYNVVLITVNLLRVDHVSAYGYGRETTPALDELAKKSFVFTSMFTNSDYTMPNMMSMITSLYPVAHGVFDVFKDELSPRVKTLAEILKTSGFNTSWYALQMPHLDTKVGFGRGYDEVVALKRDHSNVDTIIRWIKKNKEQPFFMALNTRSIHPPYMPPPEYKDRFFDGGKKGAIVTTEVEFQKAWYMKILELMKTPDSCMYGVFTDEVIAKNSEIFNGEFQEEKLSVIHELLPEVKKIRLGTSHIETFKSMIDPYDRENLEYAISLYDACVYGIDQKLIKPIISVLKETGLYEKTLLIITGDHGETLGEHNFVGHSKNFYEQIIHVPMIIKYPFLKERVNIGDLAQSSDVMPTILDILNIQQPFYTQGKSLVPLLENNFSAPLHEYVYGEKRQQAYIRSDTWKLVIDLEKDKDVKVCSWARLFNIKDDPGERRNLCSVEKSTLQKMMDALLDHLDSTPHFIDKNYQFLPSIDKKTRKRIRETGYW